MKDHATGYSLNLAHPEGHARRTGVHRSPCRRSDADRSASSSCSVFKDRVPRRHTVGPLRRSGGALPPAGKVVRLSTRPPRPDRDFVVYTKVPSRSTVRALWSSSRADSQPADSKSATGVYPLSKTCQPDVSPRRLCARRYPSYPDREPPGDAGPLRRVRRAARRIGRIDHLPTELARGSSGTICTPERRGSPRLSGPRARQPHLRLRREA